LLFPEQPCPERAGFAVNVLEGASEYIKRKVL